MVFKRGEGLLRKGGVGGMFESRPGKLDECSASR